MKINAKILEEVKGVKSAEELKTLLESKNVTLTDEQTKELFSKIHADALADEDLEQVVGGLSLYRRLDPPNFK